MAATGVSPSLPEDELADASRSSRRAGRPPPGGGHPRGRAARLPAQRPDRCFFCKDELFEVLGPPGRGRGLALAVGTNTDDLGDHRPGQRAAAAHGVLAPLVAAGLSKAEVREGSRRLGLRTADKPAAACLASVAYGVQVSPAVPGRAGRGPAPLLRPGLLASATTATWPGSRSPSSPSATWSSPTAAPAWSPAS